MRATIPPAVRFWAKVVKAGPVPDYAPELGPCWIWTGEINDRGYGSFREGEGSRHVGAHRYAWELTRGPIPEGLTIDHLCRVHPCVNPDHLEPVTPRVNVLRGFTITAANAAKTHCIWGHEFTPENTYWYAQGRKRQCRECRGQTDRDHKRATYVRRPPQDRVGTYDSHCANGHPRTPESTYVLFRRGGIHRTCRICNREAAARSKNRKAVA